MDIDWDGDPDFFINGFSPLIIAWYENDNLNWTQNIIDDTLAGCEVFDVADIDNDGIVELWSKPKAFFSGSRVLRPT